MSETDIETQPTGNDDESLTKVKGASDDVSTQDETAENSDVTREKNAMMSDGLTSVPAQLDDNDPPSSTDPIANASMDRIENRLSQSTTSSDASALETAPSTKRSHGCDDVSAPRQNVVGNTNETTEGGENPEEIAGKETNDSQQSESHNKRQQQQNQEEQPSKDQTQVIILAVDPPSPKSPLIQIPVCTGNNSVDLLSSEEVGEQTVSIPPSARDHESIADGDSTPPPVVNQHRLVDNNTTHASREDAEAVWLHPSRLPSLRQTEEESLINRIETLRSALQTILLGQSARSPRRKRIGGGNDLPTTVLSSSSPTRQTTCEYTSPLADGVNSSSGSPTMSTSRRRSIAQTGGKFSLQSLAQVDFRRMRDGLIAMSTEAKQEDFETIVCKRELRLVEALDEKMALQKKLDRVNHDVETLSSQKQALVSLRQNHHSEMTRLRSELGALTKETNLLKWDETRIHREITDHTNSLQRYRRKWSTEETKLMQELNTVSFELQSLERAVDDEKQHYATEWAAHRRDLRETQEEIVAFNPKEWLAAAQASGKEKVWRDEFGGDAHRAHQFMSATLAAQGRRRTVANIELKRSGLDAFLQGGEGGGAAEVRDGDDESEEGSEAEME